MPRDLEIVRIVDIISGKLEESKRTGLNSVRCSRKKRNIGGSPARLLYAEGKDPGHPCFKKIMGVQDFSMLSRLGRAWF
jgi:hypothetical protein